MRYVELISKWVFIALLVAGVSYAGFGWIQGQVIFVDACGRAINGRCEQCGDLVDTHKTGKVRHQRSDGKWYCSKCYLDLKTTPRFIE